MWTTGGIGIYSDPEKRKTKADDDNRDGTNLCLQLPYNMPALLSAAAVLIGSASPRQVRQPLLQFCPLRVSRLQGTPRVLQCIGEASDLHGLLAGSLVCGAGLALHILQLLLVQLDILREGLDGGFQLRAAQCEAVLILLQLLTAKSHVRKKQHINLEPDFSFFVFRVKLVLQRRQCLPGKSGNDPTAHLPLVTQAR